MPAYIPPHRKKLVNNNNKISNNNINKKYNIPNNFNFNYRRKALVIPVINNKYIVTKNKKSGQTTFISGGCKTGEKIRNCALKELGQESRYSIKNINLKKQFTFTIDPSFRSSEELAQNKNRRIFVLTRYHAFLLKTKKPFKEIYNNFHKFKPVPNSKNDETSNIMLMSLNNLNKNEKLWSLMRLKVLPKLKV